MPENVISMVIPRSRCTRWKWQPPNLQNQIWRTQRGRAATAWRTS